jgi:3-hydroxyisobutyrate dehydrogenase
VIALAGLGRMGGAIAQRLSAARLELRLFDVAAGPRQRFRVGFDSLADAASGCDIVLLCLPDAAAVEAAVGDLLRAKPPPALVLDLTSSVPKVTRRLGSALAARGVGLIDAPMSGGVAGARDGRLTVMVGGSSELLERARPILTAFAERIFWAGELGSGHAVKAINNTLSAVSLVATSQALKGAHEQEADALAYFNSHRGRSQNSEVKFPRDILPRSFSAGFTIGLMQKDVGIALGMDGDLPITFATHELLERATEELGADTDFTRIFEFVEPWHPAGLEELDARIYAACEAAANELLDLAAAVGLDRTRALEIINASTGRSQATVELAGAAAWR